MDVIVISNIVISVMIVQGRVEQDEYILYIPSLLSSYHCFHHFHDCQNFIIVMLKVDIINITIIIMILIMIMIKVDMSKMDIPPALLMKSNDHEISREEETTVILQVCRRINHI